MIFERPVVTALHLLKEYLPCEFFLVSLQLNSDQNGGDASGAGTSCKSRRSAAPVNFLRGWFQEAGVSKFLSNCDIMLHQGIGMITHPSLAIDENMVRKRSEKRSFILHHYCYYCIYYILKSFGD